MATHRQLLDDGLRHHHAGRLDEAGLCYRQVLAEAPDDAEANHLAGVLAFQSGRVDEAATRFGRAVAGDGASAKYHGNLGAALLALGRYDEAVAILERSGALDPAAADVRLNLAAAYREAGRFDEAIATGREATALAPDNAETWIGLAATLLRALRAEEALVAAERAVAVDPAGADALNTQGVALHALGRDDEAMTVLERALASAPQHVDAHCNMGLVLAERFRFEDAAVHYRFVVTARPDDPAGHAGLAHVLRSQGEPDEALRHYRRAIALMPDRVRAQSSFLFHLLGSPDTDGKTLVDDHRAWASRFVAPLAGSRRPLDTDPDPDRRLRIGYVSPDLRNHPVGRLLLPVLSAHDRATVETICYADMPHADGMSAALRAAADGWRGTGAMTDAALDEQIRRDGVDILVDLAGHTAHNRQLVFARRPAPVQATWLGYVSTTGNDGIDWVIADPVHAPPGTDNEFTERVMRLPHDLLCFAPPDDAPAVGPLPSAESGHIVFASFNNPGKLSSATLALWARVLTAVPGSRLLLRYRVLEDPAVQRRLRARFAAAGIDPARVDLAGQVPYREVLDSYNRVDIALDTTPYSGTMTTLEALWMGVPVVALAGDRMAARQSAAHLSAAGLDDLVAGDADGYVAIATTLARDPVRLAALRAGMRTALAASPLCDVSGFVRALEGAFRTMWHDWCARRATSS